ncbi:chloride channel protein [Aromatoleum toluvorans]|uniref:Chloride channel protein n=1 Tax=Aromatoleum toluvorans TaxID=92002 RepID=A0ABX1PX76_9RHOO|nr:chloride channel protein [Aromatoleum toluvorans]
MPDASCPDTVFYGYRSGDTAYSQQSGPSGLRSQRSIVSPPKLPTDEKRASLTFRQIARTGRRYTNPLISVGHWRRRALLVGAALLAGLIAIVFAIGSERAIGLHARLIATSPWLSLLVAPAGFAAMAWLSGRFVPATQGSGIPQTIAASLSPDPAVRGRLLSLKIAVAKVFLTLGGLLCGASIGREGPSVQIGASVMHALAGRRFGRIASSRNLIVAGSGAGIAAAFNTPVGGIMFAIEEMCRDHAFRANGTTLTAVIFAGLMSLGILGNYTYFGSTPAALNWPLGIWPVLICGTAGGLLGGTFSRLLVASARGLPGRVGDFAAAHPIAFAGGCGLATALVGLATGGATYATGYAESKAALEGLAPLPVYFFAAKMLVIWLAFVSRIPGGLFAPALAVGAGLGSALAGLSPGNAEPALVILGMVAFLSGMTLAPITSFVIVMEMTANHQMLIPLMAASVIAYGFSKSVSPRALYDALAAPALDRAQAEVASVASGKPGAA